MWSNNGVAFLYARGQIILNIGLFGNRVIKMDYFLHTHKNNDQKLALAHAPPPQPSVDSCRCFLPGPPVSNKVACWQAADGKGSGPLGTMTAWSACRFPPSGRQTELYLAPILECSTLLGAGSWRVPRPYTGLCRLEFILLSWDVA